MRLERKSSYGPHPGHVQTEDKVGPFDCCPLRPHTLFDMPQPVRWEIRFYRDKEGREPVREWLEALERTAPTESGRIRHHIDLLGEFGVHLSEMEQQDEEAMTTWQQYKGKRPLGGEAKRAYKAEREAMGVGYLILKARARAGLSQSQLAKKLGTSQPTIARWESGSQIPSVRSLLKIAKATGLDLALGLKKPGASPNVFEVLEILHPRGSTARGEILKEVAG